jgi:hypothetical protein
MEGQAGKLGRDSLCMLLGALGLFSAFLLKMLGA